MFYVCCVVCACVLLFVRTCLCAFLCVLLCNGIRFVCFVSCVVLVCVLCLRCLCGSLGTYCVMLYGLCLRG